LNQTQLLATTTRMIFQSAQIQKLTKPTNTTNNAVMNDEK
jgi:hypothetical protein